MNLDINPAFPMHQVSNQQVTLINFFVADTICLDYIHTGDGLEGANRYHRSVHNQYGTQLVENCHYSVATRPNHVTCLLFTF